MSSFTKLHKEHPYRPVNWRWARARFLRENKIDSVSRQDNDPWVTKALKFQKKLDKCKTEIERYKLMESDRDLYYAYDMWDEEEGEYANPTRYEVEARLLTDEPLNVIAKKVCAPLETIIWYERLFFNVKDRLASESYVANQAMGPALHRGFSERHYDLIWKLYAFTHGVIALEALMIQTSNPIKVTTRAQMDSVFVDDAKSTIRRRSAIAARTLRSDSLSQISMLEMHHKFQQLERDLASGQQEATILENIKAMMPILPWAVGRVPSKAMDQNLVAYYDKNHSAEPRADELLAAALGEQTTAADELHVYDNAAKRMRESKPNL